MDNTTRNLLDLRKLINDKVHLVLAGGKYFERINPCIKKPQEKQFYTVGQGTIWVANGNTETEGTNSLEGNRIKIVNTHGVYEITADEDSLTGTFNKLECAKDISECQDNVTAKILDQFTITNQVAVKVNDGELKFGLDSVSLYPVEGKKEKLCGDGSCHVIFTHTGKIAKNNTANITTQITVGKKDSLLNTVYTLDNNVDINQFKALVTYLSEKGFLLTKRLKLDTYLIDSDNPDKFENFKTMDIENDAIKLNKHEGVFVIDVNGKLIPVYKDDFTDGFISEYFSSFLQKTKRKNRRFK
jgi:hypothetical protein